MTLRTTVKALGILAGFLLIGYGYVIAGADRYDDISNKYAASISTVGVILVLVATGGFFTSRVSLGLEAAGYIIGLGGGTWSFWHIANNQQHFERA